MIEKRNVIEIEDQGSPPFFKKIPIVFERGEGIYAYDDKGKEYIDFTAGWGVTSIGHANPVITEALCSQGNAIIQNPNSGASYSPSRAKLLQLFQTILPHDLTRVFFASSGAESNDAAIKLARKASGKKNIISTIKSFHGRTISTASATGQNSHRDRYKPLMPHYLFVPFNDINAVKAVIKEDAAAVIVEPIQGEGGIILPSETYLEELSEVCLDNNVYLILDEIQTGFFRTGPIFASSPYSLKVDFMTMAKGIGGGFPFAAFAISEEVSAKLTTGDHGGTYCGNPLGCAVSYAVIKYMLDNNIQNNVEEVSIHTFNILEQWKEKFSIIKDVRGKGLLIAIELSDDSITTVINNYCIQNGLLLNITHGNIIRIFPALTITKEEINKGLDILYNALSKLV